MMTLRELAAKLWHRLPATTSRDRVETVIARIEEAFGALVNDCAVLAESWARGKHTDAVSTRERTVGPGDFIRSHFGVKR